MNFIKRLAVAFYVVLNMFIGAMILLMAADVIKYPTISKLLYLIYHDPAFRMSGIIAAAVLLFVNYLFYQFFTVNVKRNRIIAFDNPNGRVTVSLSALEELIKRMLSETDEIREAKPSVTASRRGLNIRIRLSLSAENSVPSISSKVQSAVTKKVQDVIGLDEKVNVTIYIGRIYPEVVKEAKKVKKTEPQEENKPTNVPFHGYRP